MLGGRRHLPGYASCYAGSMARAVLHGRSQQCCSLEPIFDPC